MGGRSTNQTPANPAANGPSRKLRTLASLAIATAAFAAGLWFWYALPQTPPPQNQALGTSSASPTQHPAPTTQHSTPAPRQPVQVVRNPAPLGPLPPAAIGPDVRTVPTTNPKPLGPIALGPAPSIAPMPAPTSIAPAQLSVGDPAKADPMEFAFHPSRFADPARIAKTVSPIILSADPTSKPTTPDRQPPTTDHYSEALRLEKARAFAMSLCLDTQGRLWVGSENTTPGDGTGGVQCYDPSKPPLEAWTQYLSDDSANRTRSVSKGANVQGGLGDDNGYALACDHQGRIWVGHLNHGISVFNGQKWQNYEVVAGLSIPSSLNGPLGERIFKIVVAPEFSPSPLLPVSPSFHDSLTGKDSPLSGSIWMCTSAGLAVYFPSTDTWSYITRAEGMPSDQANSFAFGTDGSLYVATQCDGIAIARPGDHYAEWKQIARRASDVAREQGTQHSEPRTQNSELSDDLPTTASGTGLPSNLMNDILVGKDGTTYAATAAGVAWSKDKGETWQYVRGADYAAKVRGLATGAPPGWREQTGASLPEDFCVGVSEDSHGEILIAYRKEGIGPFKSNRPRLAAGKITCLTTTSYDTVFYGTLYGGVDLVGGTNRPLPLARNSEVQFPAAAATIKPEQMASLRSGVATGPTKALQFLGEDHATLGDWVGRYGRQYAKLCAANTPFDDDVKLDNSYKVKAIIGSHGNDKMRSWAEGASSINPNGLWDPFVGTRRVSQWDDHGEAYAPAFDGPNIWVRATVPAGLYRISFFFYDQDAAIRPQGEHLRDYLMLGGLDSGAEGQWSQAPVVRVRVSNFHQGVYKQFTAIGPQTYRFQIRREGSTNTVLAGVFVDRVFGLVTSPTESPEYLPTLTGVRYELPRFPEEAAAATLLDSLLRWCNPPDQQSYIAAVPSLRYRRLQVFRAASALPNTASLQAALRWRLPVWTTEDRIQWRDVVWQGWQGFLTANPRMANNYAKKPQN